MSGSRDISTQPPVYRRSRSNSHKHSISKKQTKKEVHSKPNIILSIFLGILAVIFMCAFIALMVLRTVNITRVTVDVIKDLDIAMILENFDDTHYLINQINDLPFHDTEIHYSDIDYFIKKDAVVTEFAIAAERYFRALAAGNLDYHITADDIITHSFNIEPELHALFTEYMTYEDYEYLAMIMDDVLDLRAFSINGIAEDFEIDVTLPAYIMSPALFGIVGLISAVFLILIIFINKSKPPIAFLIVGITIMLSGLIVFSAGIWLDASLESLSESIHRLIIHMDGFANHTSQYGFIFAAIGLLITVISFSISRLPKNRN